MSAEKTYTGGNDFRRMIFWFSNRGRRVKLLTFILSMVETTDMKKSDSSFLVQQLERLVWLFNFLVNKIARKDSGENTLGSHAGSKLTQEWLIGQFRLI